MPRQLKDQPLPTPQRSALMAKVRGKNTKPELVVRSMLHSMGYRFRLHRRDLPGSPDIVFPSRRAVLFVHGCFWHRHEGCRLASTPKTRARFWSAKFEANVKRDQQTVSRLNALGWNSAVVWGCETRDPISLRAKLDKIMGDLAPAPVLNAEQRALEQGCTRSG